MSLTRENYTKRLIDDKIELYLQVFGAISIEGPKWCGKTWTSLNHASSVIYMSEKENVRLAKEHPRFIFTEKRPELIDEWQLVPSIWDAVRHECDKDHNRGKFILTGSTTLVTVEDDDEQVYHTGTGRIAPLTMYPMSLYESGVSSGTISIMDMFDNKDIGERVKKFELDEIAKLLIRGGWPENINTDEKAMTIIPKKYLESVIKKDIHERKDRKRDSNKMRMLIKSLARNESNIVSYDTLVKDIEEYNTGEEKLESRQTVADYISVLDSLFLTTYQEAFSINYLSSKRVGKSSKRHLVDPSLACAALELSVDKLLHDFKTFGLLFESLVERDLKIYIEYLDGHLYHFRDNESGDEVDAILEFEDGEYAACEIKLSYNAIDDAKKSLLKFYEKVEKKPKFMCVIAGTYGAVHKDKETGIYILPITALKP